MVKVLTVEKWILMITKQQTRWEIKTSGVSTTTWTECQIKIQCTTKGADSGSSRKSSSLSQERSRLGRRPLQTHTANQLAKLDKHDKTLLTDKNTLYPQFHHGPNIIYSVKNINFISVLNITFILSRFLVFFPTSKTARKCVAK